MATFGPSDLEFALHEAQWHRLNLKTKTVLSRQYTSSIDAHSMEAGTLAGSPETNETSSELHRCCCMEGEDDRVI